MHRRAVPPRRAPPAPRPPEPRAAPRRRARLSLGGLAPESGSGETDIGAQNKESGREVQETKNALLQNFGELVLGCLEADFFRTEQRDPLEKGN